MNTKKERKEKPNTKPRKPRDLTSKKDTKGGGGTAAQRKETPTPIPPAPPI
jgi:hypothetical protein